LQDERVRDLVHPRLDATLGRAGAVPRSAFRDPIAREDCMSPRSLPFLSRPLAAAILSACMLSAVAADAQSPKLDVIYVPTPAAVVDKMLEMAQVRGDDYLIDLGSGDGRIPVAAARKHGARGFGVDIDPDRVKEAQANAEKAGVADKVEFRVQNLFDTKIGDATVLSLYLLTRLNLDLRPRILSELRPGTRVVSHAFRHGRVEGGPP
jgi:predicted O-methyltransferase YrrM